MLGLVLGRDWEETAWLMYSSWSLDSVVAHRSVGIKVSRTCQMWAFALSQAVGY